MSDRVVLVTGGAGSLGTAVCSRLLAGGDRVSIPLYGSDQRADLQQLRERHGDDVHTFALDLTTERGAESAIRETVEWGGRLDSLVHLIGGFAGGSKIAETPADVWSRMLDLNLASASLAARFALAEMERAGRGSCVFVAARAGLDGAGGNAAYAAAKAGLVAMVKSAGREYRGRGIRVNAVAPDTLDTPANRRAMPDADFDQWTQPAAIADVIAFLLSDAARAINGVTIPVFGPA